MSLDIIPLQVIVIAMPSLSKIKTLTLCALLLGGFLSGPRNLLASSDAKLDETQVQTIEKTAITSAETEQQRQAIAVMLAEYEFDGRKLLERLDNGADRTMIDQQAGALLAAGEQIMAWARFRLRQCDAYLGRALELKALLADITLDVLERDYHHDGALPQAPPECYHVKDTFVHPATVLVLTRLDPSLAEDTIAGIRTELLEVLGHTEVMRQLVVY